MSVVNVSSIKVLNDNTSLLNFFTSLFLRSHPSHMKVWSFAGQSQYLYFAIIVRLRVLVLLWESSFRLAALHLSALTTCTPAAVNKVTSLFLQYQSRPSSTASSSGKSPRHTSTPRAPVPPSQRPNTAAKPNGSGGQGSRSIGTQTRSVKKLHDDMW